MMKQFAIGLAGLAVLGGCSGDHAPSPKAAHASTTTVTVTTLPSKAEIAALFDQWNEALQTSGPHDVALLYAEDGVLLPTVSNQVRSNREEIADYFEHFLELQPRGVINEQHIDILDYNTAVNSGVYTFDLEKPEGPTFVVARYSFVYEKVGGKWLIKSHHSSAMPELVEGRPKPLKAKLAKVAKTPVADESEGHDKTEDHGHGDDIGHDEKPAKKKAKADAHH
jgi:uncharacterized protein (TIGR02246 family)